MDISRKILSDPVIKWLFKEGRADTYLVGGYIRDLLSGKTSKDIDFVVSCNAEKLARRTARRFKGTFILLKEGQTYRVVLKDKTVIDINVLEGTIEADLMRRDFTVNAIAWSPDSGLIDMSDGIGDIKKRVIKAVRPRNLKNDPLRMLRAYRLAAEIGFKIEKKTRNLIKNNSKLIRDSAFERITEELIRISNNKDSGKYLRLCCSDGILEKIVNLPQERLSKNLRIMTMFDNGRKYLNIDKLFKAYETSQGLTISGIIRLAAIFNGFEGIRGINHMLKLSRANTVALAKTLSAIFRAHSCRVTKRSMYSVFIKSEEMSIASAILISIIKRRDPGMLVQAAQRFESFRTRPLLTGDDIQRLLGVGPGREIGSILSAVEEERFHGNITTNSEAEGWIVSNLT